MNIIPAGTTFPMDHSVIGSFTVEAIEFADIVYASQQTYLEDITSLESPGAMSEVIVIHGPMELTLRDGRRLSLSDDYYYAATHGGGEWWEIEANREHGPITLAEHEAEEDMWAEMDYPDY